MSLIGCHTASVYPDKKHTWRYIKGSDKDFLGAPEWATHRMFNDTQGEKSPYNQAFTSGIEKGDSWESCNGDNLEGRIECPQWWYIIAQRERVTSIEDEMLAADLERFKRKVDERFQKSDNVNHPKHYTQGGIECIDAIKAATVGKSGVEAVCVANVVKYLWRYEEKNGVEDVKKARWYLERLISELESGESK